MRRRTFLQTLAMAVAVPWTRLLAPGVRKPLLQKPKQQLNWQLFVQVSYWDDSMQRFVRRESIFQAPTG